MQSIASIEYYIKATVIYTILNIPIIYSFMPLCGLQDLKSAHPHPTKRTNDGGREEKQLTEKMYVKNKQRHISMHEYMSNKKKNSKTKTSKKNVVSNRKKRRR